MKCLDEMAKSPFYTNLPVFNGEKSRHGEEISFSGMFGRFGIPGQKLDLQDLVAQVGLAVAAQTNCPNIAANHSAGSSNNSACSDKIGSV